MGGVSVRLGRVVSLVCSGEGRESGRAWLFFRWQVCHATAFTVSVPRVLGSGVMGIQVLGGGYAVLSVVLVPCGSCGSWGSGWPQGG